jgi:hypothetical protein
MMDPVSEWFPALTGRPNLTTIQGSEWTRGAEFWELVQAYQRIQTCALQDAACVQRQAEELGLDYDYLYVEKAISGYPCPKAGEACVHSGALIDSLRESAQPVFENEAVVIFEMLDGR